ncbi:hypothetical protein BKH42_05635 [Helicobacter sp. 13S00482-2]|uniref:KCU-star family selenoprotein n=1 Tax=Helicobacter sp. 13S00482-2 TaxID=1476200 RepID=UPI000BA5ADB1|nr:KCU-star family selenoprotein [Helicobacter sp. 13S00482-2]PAF53527.1 hypothetical protein BKH42_05635 [Helicobacter sp. 13S00482-2]
MGFLSKIQKAYRKSDRFFHLLVGLPSYDKYIEYMEKFHPDKIPKTQKEFFIDVQESRYGKDGSKKC